MTQPPRCIALDERGVALVRGAKAPAAGRLQEQFISLAQHNGCFGRKYFWLLRRALPREQALGSLTGLAPM